MNKWDERFIQLAEHVALWSKDPSTKVGAVLVGRDRREIALGYNGFPPGVPDHPEWLNDREVKLTWTQHAERNVLDNARFDTRGGTIYVTLFPCHECAKSIVSRGIVRVVAPMILPGSRWYDEAEISKMIFHETGVKFGE